VKTAACRLPMSDIRHESARGAQTWNQS